MQILVIKSIDKRTGIYLYIQCIATIRKLITRIRIHPSEDIVFEARIQQTCSREYLFINDIVGDLFF